MKIISIILIFITIINISCSKKIPKIPRGVYWTQENKKIDTCRKRWIYKDLQNKDELTVLLSSHAVLHLGAPMQKYTNFVIGISTVSKDTVGFLMYRPDKIIKNGDKIKIAPHQLTDSQKSATKPPFSVSSNPKDNDLHCSVKIIYYGIITDLIPSK